MVPLFKLNNRKKGIPIIMGSLRNLDKTPRLKDAVQYHDLNRDKKVSMLS